MPPRPSLEDARPIDTIATGASDDPRREPPAPWRIELSRRALLQGPAVLALLASASVMALAGATAPMPVFEPEPWDDGTLWDDGTGWVA